MARPKKQDAVVEKPAVEISERPVRLGQLLSKKPIFQAFRLWIVGDTPLIVHAWSQKAKLEMLQKQTKAIKPGKQERDPNQDFVDSLYEMSNKTFGFPATGVKNAILSAAHKDRGIARTAVMSALFLDADMVSVRPALAGAVCDMPLIRVYGSDPVMREDMVKIGSVVKTANLAYRGQFSVWAMRVTGKFNPSVITGDALAMLVQDSGLSSGLGEWRNERRGVFGAFHLGSEEEEERWEKYVSGKGDLPIPSNYIQEAAE